MSELDKTDERLDLEQVDPQPASGDSVPTSELALRSLLRRCRFGWAYALVFNVVTQLIEPRVNRLPGWWLFWTLNLSLCGIRLWLVTRMSRPGGLTPLNIQLWGYAAPLHGLVVSCAVCAWYLTFGLDGKALLATLVISGMTLTNLVNYRPNLRILRRVVLAFLVPPILTALWIGTAAGWAVGLHLIAILAFCLYQSNVENREFWEALHAMRAVKIATQRVERAAQIHAELMATRTRQNVLAAERSRIAAEWHDTLLAGFSAISWQIDTAENELPSDAAASAQALRLARNMLKHYRVEARSVIADLQILPDHGNFHLALSQALEPLISNRPIKLEVEAATSDLILQSQKTYHLIRICQEAVANAVEHASPKHIVVKVANFRGVVTAEVQDDGTGFELGQSPTGHYGLEIMRERANHMGGDFQIFTKPGFGTRVVVKIPSVESVVVRTARILIVQNQDDSGPSLRQLLQARRDLEIVAVATQGSVAIQSFRQHLPDVTIVDARLPDMNGVEVRAAIHALDPFARVLVLASLERDSPLLLQSIDAVLAKYPLRANSMPYDVSAIPATNELTPVERDVLEQLVQGLDTGEIATCLGIAEKNVRIEVANIVSKLGAADTTNAIKIALRRGVVERPPKARSFAGANSNAIL